MQTADKSQRESAGKKTQLCSKWFSCGSQGRSSKKGAGPSCADRFHLSISVSESYMIPSHRLSSVLQPGKVGTRTGPEGREFVASTEPPPALEWKQNYHELCCTSLFTSLLPWAEFWPRFRDLSSVQATHKNVRHDCCCYIIIQCC